MSATFVGFGFGPIQTGLLLFEAVQSGSFDRFVVAEVDQRLVDAVRAAGDEVVVNIAGKNGIRTGRIPKVELCNPQVTWDRSVLVEAIVDADEMGTAVPSIDLYSAGKDASIAAMLAKGCRPGRRQIIYTAENNNFAAEILREQIGRAGATYDLHDLQCLNTVVGKMSGVVSSPSEMKRLGLAPLVPGYDRCVLVEEFNRILISKVTLPGFRRKIRVFEEKDDLLPFEEAKLYGHNAVHALLGYLARLRGHDVMSAIGGDEKLLRLGRQVFREESGAALVRKHAGTGDPLFTPAGFAAYAEDLIERMVNPWLFDRVDRIIRDPARKLGWKDRLFGTMRICLEAGIAPTGMSLGAAAATEFARSQEKERSDSPRAFLSRLWGDEAAEPAREACLRLVEQAVPRLEEWRN
jgi:mannitol-1-phosphate 5-dehydrogenase